MINNKLWVGHTIEAVEEDGYGGVIFKLDHNITIQLYADNIGQVWMKQYEAKTKKSDDNFSIRMS